MIWLGKSSRALTTKRLEEFLTQLFEQNPLSLNGFADNANVGWIENAEPTYVSGFTTADYSRVDNGTNTVVTSIPSVSSYTYQDMRVQASSLA